jgi:hypothetical protein
LWHSYFSAFRSFLLLKIRASAGKIVDRKSGKLIGVTITVEKTQIVTQTDIDGKFILSNIPTGVQPQAYVGYEPLTNSMSRPATPTFFKMNDAATELAGVEIVNRSIWWPLRRLKFDSEAFGRKKLRITGRKF